MTGTYIPGRSSDPSNTELADGKSILYQSDGSAGVTGSDGDLILATNQGGSVKTFNLHEFAANVMALSNTDLDAGGSGLTGVASLNGGLTGNSQLSNIVGTNLSIDGNGDLNAATGTTAFNQQFGIGSFSVSEVGNGIGDVLWDSFELREPGNGASAEEVRIFTNITFDPSESWTIKFDLANITIDAVSSAVIAISLTDSVDASFLSGDDYLVSQLRGAGGVRARTSEDGTSNTSTDNTQDNAFASAANYIQMSFDGTSLTTEVSDGTTTITTSSSSNYPSGENLALKVTARDADPNTARNVDFDVTGITVS